MQIHRAEFAGVDGMRLAADAFGSSSDPPLLCFPGAGQTRRTWRRAAEAFASHGRYVISLDLRGHGDSAWACDGDYSIDAFVGDVRAIVRALASPPVIVGASIAGIAGLIAVGEAPGMAARALVLVDVVPGMQQEGLDRIRAFMTAGIRGFANLEEARATVDAHLPNRRTRKSDRGLEHNLRHDADGRLRWHWDPAFHAGSRDRARRGMFERMAAATAGVRIPTLLVSGTRSEVVAEQGVAELLRLIPQAEHYEVKNAAHMVVGDDNDAFAAAVIGFIDRLDSAPTGP
jgi:pimeloyl-ACP methyl ester carboxylesterase